MVFPVGDFMNAVRDNMKAAGLVLPAEQFNKDSPPADTVALWYKGAEFVRTGGRPPRYVWVPGDISPINAYKGDIGNQQRALTGGGEDIWVHCWGKDDDQAWTLRHNFLSQAKLTGRVNVTYRGCQRLRQEEQGTDFGVVYLTRISIDVPVVDEALAIVEPAEATTVGSIMINGTPTVSCGG